MVNYSIAMMGNPAKQEEKRIKCNNISYLQTLVKS